MIPPAKIAYMLPYKRALRISHTFHDILASDAELR
jgi:hypothetical protein